ncbi:MAG: ABC transporter substrate-binding protein [Chloroflexi bacterium]|nr:ABC transporter substrate-binding protein [Chloroflexota bacterium]
MKNKVIWLLFSGLVVLSLVLASCAPAAPTQPAAPAKPATPAAPTTPTTPTAPTTPAAPAGPAMVKDSLGRLVEKPRYGGIFTIPLDRDVEGMTLTFNSPQSADTMKITHERMLTGNFLLGPSGSGKVSWQFSIDNLDPQVGQLAESWEIPDDQTIILHIRKGVHWQLNPYLKEASALVGGREFTAADAVFSITRVYGHAKGYLNTRVRAEEKPVSVTAPDKYTVVIKTVPGWSATVSGYLHYNNTFNPDVIQKFGDQAEYDWRNHIGTGPFMISDVVPASSYTFVRNSNYWGKHPLFPEDTMPYLDGVKYLIITDVSTRMAALRTAKVDHGGAARSTVSLSNAVTILAQKPELKYVETINRYPLVMILKVNNPAIPSYDKRVRQAIAMAIDHPSIVKDLYGGRASLLNYPIMPAGEFLSMYTPLEQQPEIVQQMYGYNPDKAKKLLADAGYPNGFKMELVTLTDYTDQASVIKDHLSKVGIVVDIQVKERTVFTSLTNARNQKDAVLTTGTSTSPFAFQAFSPEDLNNIGGINDPVANETWAKFKPIELTDRAKAEAIIKPFFVYALEQAWHIQYPDPHEFLIWWPWVKTYNGEVSVGRSANYNFIPYLWIDQTLKKKMGY